MEDTVRAMGNIKPYENDLITRIKQNWHPKKKVEMVTVRLFIDREGKLRSFAAGERGVDMLKSALERVLAMETTAVST
jgi:hypothetical protein